MNNSFENLAQAESQIFASQIVSPVTKGQPISVRIAGVIMRFSVRLPNFEGWGVFRPCSYRHVRLERYPTLEEKRVYLSLFRPVRLVLCRKHLDRWHGVLVGNPHIRAEGLPPVLLTDAVQIFDKITAVFDGGHFWHHPYKPNQDYYRTVYLREQLKAMLEPSKLKCPGLVPEEYEAYQTAYFDCLKNNKNMEEERLRIAIERAGAVYRNYLSRGDTYTVEYTVGGEAFKSVVNKDTLAVESAGICLSGGDKLFDLQSLIPVIAQGQARGHIVHVGSQGGMTQEGYERMYGNNSEGDYYDDE